MATLVGKKIQPGDTIGRCRIVRELGKGGMGTVYLASHKTLKIDVALKILSPSLAQENQSLAERFIREAQMAARIRHPNVIAVMDADHDEKKGIYFIIQEYVSGGSLSWHLRHGPLPEAKALAIVNGIAHALVVAEENGIVHRDIKPDNIMLDSRGTAKLADLGLAKQALDSHISLTFGGAFMGTPAYMSPDQARDAKTTDTRDDIYSLGATFFEMLTGQPPFRGDTPYNIMSELLTKPTPRPRDLRPEIGQALDLVCAKMMAKNRQLRYANARLLIRDLDLVRREGDEALPELEASRLEEEQLSSQDTARDLGVETSAEGVAIIPDLPENSHSSWIAPEMPVFTRPRQRDYRVFAVAGALVGVVSLATLVLLWMNLHHRAHKTIPIQVASTKKISKPVVSDSHPVELVTPPLDLPPTLTDPNTAVEPPIAQSVPTSTTPLQALPVDGTAPPSTNGVVPAQPVVNAETAFSAQTVAQQFLGGPASTSGLLGIKGARDRASLTPTAWTFSYYDKSASNNARIITVRNHAVVANDDPLQIERIFTPYHPNDALAPEKLLIDSDRAFQIATSLVPSANITSSAFSLVQPKNGTAYWKITLWAKAANGDEVTLGNVNILSDTGAVQVNDLHPEKLSQH